MYFFVFAAALLHQAPPPDTPPKIDRYPIPAAVICTSIEDLKKLNSMPVPPTVKSVADLVEAGKALGYNCKFVVAITAHNVKRVEDAMPIKQRSGKMGYFYEITLTEDSFPVPYFLIGNAGLG